MGRWVSITHAFDNPVTLWIIATIGLILILSGVVITILTRRPGIDPRLKSDLTQRFRSWLILAPLMVIPILLGTIPAILAVMLLSLLAHREFARATGLFRDSLTSICVVLGILVITFAALDNWYGLFTAAIPLAIVLMAGINVARDEPDGYLQRVALGILSFGLFGSALGHMGMLANDLNFRPVILWLIFCVQINDVFAYISGKLFGSARLLPQTSPGKTVAGAVGALILTSVAAALLAPAVFRGTELATFGHGLAMGVLISVLGQMGDLVISSVKRDIGIKDMGNLFPGHGGLLDRFDSLILAAPALFHYIHYFLGVAAEQPARIITGGSL